MRRYGEWGYGRGDNAREECSGDGIGIEFEAPKYNTSVETCEDGRRVRWVALGRGG